MLYPIIRRVRRPLLPPESLSLQVPTPPAAEQASTIVEQPVVPPVLEIAIAVPPPFPLSQPETEPEFPVVPLAPASPVTETKPKRAKAAQEKSRKTVEPDA